MEDRVAVRNALIMPILKIYKPLKIPGLLQFNKVQNFDRYVFQSFCLDGAWFSTGLKKTCLVIIYNVSASNKKEESYFPFPRRKAPPGFFF